ncbi:uncharacterized protein [Watersipora subatra]|uniref:uncharacterized protein n=1 Tax=Watersipora subatra TaxID=2589382 RepID=UPI00355C73AB
MLAESDAERVSPMGDDEGGGSEVKRPTRVPSIKIEPPCEFNDSTSLPQSAMTITTNTAGGNYSALSPSMSPNQHTMVNLRNQPGNYKKNLTARFLQQGHSEDDGYYRSDTDCDMLQPEENRSKSLDGGLEYDPCDAQQPLDLSTSFYKPASGRDYHNKFEERARKMHRRQRAESEENLADLSHFNTEHLLTMQRLSRSDFQLDRIQHSQPSRQSTPSSCPAESDVLSATDSPDQANGAPGAPLSNKNLMSLPPISMVYNRGTSSSSTDGSLDMDRVSPFNPYPPSTLNPGSVNPTIAASVYENLLESGSMLPLQGMSSTNFNMSAFLQWHQMQSRINNTAANQCFICKQTFPGFDNMAKHIAKHLPTEVKTDNNNRVHVCKVCNRSFSRSDMLTRHMRLHTGLKPYECKECGQVFSRSDHLNTHKRTHTGEKPYQCPKCPYAACRRDMITRHMRIHTSKVTDKKRRKLGMLYPKDSVSGSSMESTDSTPSRGGSLSGNSFDSSFDTADLRWPQRHLLDPGDLVRTQANRSNWSASNSFDSSDFSRPRGDAWSFLASADSTESESHPHGTSFDSDLIASPPKTSSPAVFNVPVMQLANSDRPLSSAKNRRPNLVRQDASLDQDSNRTGLVSEKEPSLPFSDYKTKLEYRNSSEGRLMECSDEIDVGGIDRDSGGNVDSPRTVESPLPSQETMNSDPHILRTDYLPKQASLSDELNLQKCALNE